MKAAWYERQGAARDVFIVGQMDDPHPGSGEVRVRVAFSGISPTQNCRKCTNLTSTTLA